MNNPWLTHVMQWRKRHGDGLTYKEVLIEARKSYTPVKRGGGGGTSRMRVAPQPEPTYFTDDDDDSEEGPDEIPVAIPFSVGNAIINNIARLVAENPTMTANDIDRHYLTDIRAYERRVRSMARQNRVRPASPPVSGSGFKIIPKSIMKPIRDTDRFVRENIKQPLRKQFEPNFMTGKEKKEAKRIWDEQMRQAIKQRDLPKLDSALEYIGVNRRDNFDTIYATYLSRLEADPDDQNLKQAMGIITSYIVSTMPVLESDSRKKKKKGGALTAHELKKVLNSSYEANPTDATRNLKVDKELSGKRTKVFHDADTGQTVVAHRGTASIQDVGTDIGLAVGFRGKRFAHAKKVQKQAEKKYGTEKLDTVGHSLGGIVAEEVGGNSKNVITFNKAVVNPNRRNLKNQTDVKTSADPVSVLNRFSSNKAHVIPSQKFNPLNPFKEHTVTTLKRAKKDKQYGR
jgi:hypothetical protein